MKTKHYITSLSKQIYSILFNFWKKPILPTTINIALLVMFILATGCSKNEGKGNENLSGSNPQKINVTKSPENIDKVVGLAYIEPLARMISINSKTNGLISNIYVQPNQQVIAGQIILKMDDAVEQAQIIQAQSKIGTQQLQVNAQKMSLEALKVRTENAKVTFERNQKLMAGQAVTQQVLDDSRFAYENLQKEIIATEANISQLQRKIQEMEADVRYFQALADQKLVKAPSNGILLSMDVRLGQSLQLQTPIGDFAPDGPLMAVVEIDELYANRLSLGLKAHIRNQGTIEEIGKGSLVFMAPYLKKKSLFSDSATNLEDRRVREIRVQLDSKENILIGSRVECVVELK